MAFLYNQSLTGNRTSSCRRSHSECRPTDGLSRRRNEKALRLAIKRLISYHLLEEMQKQNINKTEMAKKMSTSRAALDRLLNPYNDSVTLATLTKAANVLGKKLVLQPQ